MRGAAAAPAGSVGPTSVEGRIGRNFLARRLARSRPGENDANTVGSSSRNRGGPDALSGGGACRTPGRCCPALICDPMPRRSPPRARLEAASATDGGDLRDEPGRCPPETPAGTVPVVSDAPGAHEGRAGGPHRSFGHRATDAAGGPREGGPVPGRRLGPGRLAAAGAGQQHPRRPARLPAGQAGRPPGADPWRNSSSPRPDWGNCWPPRSRRRVSVPSATRICCAWRTP